MPVDDNFAEQLVGNPSEALNVELKAWIDPTTPEGIAKIARACIALRNGNGGYLLIGFDDKTTQPMATKGLSDVRLAYHADKMQAIVSKYAAIPFEVNTRFVVRDSNTFPVVIVPSGVTVPVATKADLKGPDGKLLIKEHQVYVRSLNSNGTVSTTEARHQDWERLVNICLDNREADIARFLRRHLAAANTESIQKLIEALGTPAKKKLTTSDLAAEWLDTAQARFQAAINESKQTLPEFGTIEFGCVIVPALENISSGESFLNRLLPSNPRFTGWPLWLDSRASGDLNARPYVFDGGWESILIRLDAQWGGSHIDFWRVEPSGRFYHCRGLEDDLTTGRNAPAPLTALDFGLAIWRVSEAIAVALRFSQALGVVADETTLAFGFRWQKLAGRTICSWSDPMRDVLERTAKQNVVLSTVEVPANIPDSAIFQYTQQAVKPLFHVFEGFELGTSIFEEITQKALARGR